VGSVTTTSPERIDRREPRLVDVYLMDAYRQEESKEVLLLNPIITADHNINVMVPGSVNAVPKV